MVWSLKVYYNYTTVYLCNNEYALHISNAEFPTFSQTNEGHTSYQRIMCLLFHLSTKIQLSQSLTLVLLRNSDPLDKYIFFRGTEFIDYYVI